VGAVLCTVPLRYAVSTIAPRPLFVFLYISFERTSEPTCRSERARHTAFFFLFFTPSHYPTSASTSTSTHQRPKSTTLNENDESINYHETNGEERRASMGDQDFFPFPILFFEFPFGLYPTTGEETHPYELPNCGAT
jgi:hypothetical protein